MCSYVLLIVLSTAYGLAAESVAGFCGLAACQSAATAVRRRVDVDVRALCLDAGRRRG